MKSQFNEQDGKKIFEKLLVCYDKNVVLEWQGKVIKDMNRLLEKYNIISFEINPDSYMGIVAKCIDKNNHEKYIKIIPPMLERYDFETKTLKNLPEKVRCKIYEINPDSNSIVMEKINPGTKAEFYQNKTLYKKLFNDLSNRKTEKIDLSTFLTFSEVVERDYKKYKKVLPRNDIAENLYLKFQEVYSEVEKIGPKILLHGDVYKNNALLSDNCIKIIDPLGFVAPFIMELVSICAYEMFYNEEKTNKEILNDFKDFFNEFTDAKTYEKALFCQLVKLYIPSLFEANDGGIRAAKWLDIINDLY